MSLPDGYKLVPLVPTVEMLAEIHLVESFTHRAMTARYQAMLKAAPVPPQVEAQPVDVEKERAAYEAWQFRQVWPVDAMAGQLREDFFRRGFPDPRAYAVGWLNEGLSVWIGRASAGTVSDAGEVERLRGELASANADKNAYGQNAIDLKARAKKAEVERDTLRELLEEHQYQYQPYDDHSHRDAGYYCVGCGDKKGDEPHDKTCEVFQAVNGFKS